MNLDLLQSDLSRLDSSERSERAVLHALIQTYLNVLVDLNAAISLVE